MTAPEWVGTIACIVALIAFAIITDRVSKRRKREGR